MRLAVSDELPMRTVGPLGVHDYVRYQGASGDLNPLHHDPHVARAAGFADVFCPGMLSAGLVASYVADALGPTNVRELGVSFREIVWPGESLTLRARVAELREAGGERRAALELTCERPDGSVAVTGDAWFALDEAGR